MARVIIPNFSVSISEPLIYLAGPIRSAPNWQDEAIKLIFSVDENIAVASPRRGIRPPIFSYLASEEGYFPRQRAWEIHYMNLAYKTGAILFWLPGEESHDCSKVYGAMSRFELGLWINEQRRNPGGNLCFGTDGKFPEWDTINYDLSIEMPDKIIYNTLEETCSEAVCLARGR
ncbi:MAG TPA: hypothetical protein VJC39_01540 [Candidatus Nanoarchaeia archaeon]|nr:hypothetical protein [Candidatus Nanoarchaeia archaeon]